VIAYLRHPAIEKTDEGFVPVEKVYEYCQGLGFIPEQIDVAIIRSFGKRLIETAARRIPTPGKIDGSGVRPTPIGLYHIQELLGNFNYLDAVVVDTPILDPELEHYITEAHTLADRVERCFVFREYLDRCWRFFHPADILLDWTEKSAEVLTLLNRLSQRQ